MHNEILLKNQIELLPLIKTFSPEFGLVGGTAIALHLGHRRSIDFDLFTYADFSVEKIRNLIKTQYTIQSTIVEEPEELTLSANDVKLTFYKYPYRIEYTEQFDDVIRTPNILTLSAMKAFALGRRAKWKDYVDTFFILKNHTIADIVRASREVFGSEFNERLYREQLSYFEDIDYSEKIDYVSGFEVSDSEIKQALTEACL